jgi:hypothetical protein
MVSSVPALHFLISIFDILPPKLDAFSNVGATGELALLALVILYILPELVPIYTIVGLLGDTFICDILLTPVMVKLVLETDANTLIHLDKIPEPPFEYNILLVPSKSLGFTKSPVLFEPVSTPKFVALVDT